MGASAGLCGAGPGSSGQGAAKSVAASSSAGLRAGRSLPTRGGELAWSEFLRLQEAAAGWNQPGPST